MKGLAWFAGFAIGYQLGYKDGFAWGKFQGAMEMLGITFKAQVDARVATMPPPAGKRRKWWSL